MATIYLSPETVIATLKADLKNLVIRKPTAEKKAGPSTFHNLAIKVDGVERRLVIGVKTPMQIHRGLANPFDKNDSRSQYLLDPKTQQPKDTAKAQFSLTNPVIREMVELIEAAYMQLIVDNKIDTFGKIIHTHYDIGRPLEHAKNKKLLCDNPHAYQEEFKYDFPRFSANIKFSRCSEKHPDVSRRGKPESEILDYSRPIMRDGRVVSCEPASVDGSPLTAANAWKFISDGCTFYSQRWDVSAIIESASYVSCPFTIIWAAVGGGATKSDDGDMFEGLPPPPQPAAPTAPTAPAAPKTPETFEEPPVDDF